MKFSIEPINDTDCKIIGIDRSDMDGQKLTEVKIPSTIDQDGKTWNVKEVRLLIRDLTLLEIAEGVTKISGDYKYLERVSLPSTIEEIGASTFYLTEVLEHLKELPASLKRIGQCAFEKAFKFGREEDKELHILSPQISISENAFNCDARNVNRVKLVASDETIASIMGQPGALNGTAVEAINIPDGATEVYVCNCPRLKVLSIPDSVQTVRELSEIGAEIKASAEVWKKICETEGCLSEYTPKNTELQIPEGVTELAACLLWRSSITKISIPSTVEKIGYRAFQECKSLESITFAPGSMLKIVNGRETFSKNALKEVVFPDGMTTIGKGAFTDMEYLETVTFPASMTSYGNRPFVHCKKLKEVIFLADDPATATYPDHLGKMVNWYVPDHMVPYVEEFFQKTKDKYALPDGIGAKAVKPLSKRRIKK